LKIQASQAWLNKYDRQITELEVTNTRLNREFDISFTSTYFSTSNSQLIDYRQSIINEICENYDKIDRLKSMMNKQSEVLDLLMKCFYFVDKSSYF
jgi:hypothetical protein